MKLELDFLNVRLDSKTAILARYYECACLFVNDKLSKEVLTILKENGTKLIALRSAGYNHIDLAAAKELGLIVVRVSEYSPCSVAEYAVVMILCLKRKIHKAYNRVRVGNFSLDGLVGFDLHGKKVGIIGTGKIENFFLRVMRGFACEILAFNLLPDKSFEKELEFRYVQLVELLELSDIISLHVRLSDNTLHMLNEESFNKMKKGTMLINTGRSWPIDTKSLIKALKGCPLGCAGPVVYAEATLFFEDRSCEVLTDDVYARPTTFNNVLRTSYQAFLTQEALGNIAHTTMQTINEFLTRCTLSNEVKAT